jgi:microcystin-dependent protein
LGPDSFIGSVAMFVGPFAPRGWALCDGSRLSISSNVALFSIIGTRYGGDGTTYFNLPNFTGVFPVGQTQLNNQPQSKPVFDPNQPGSVNLRASDVLPPAYTATFQGQATTVSGAVTLKATTATGANVPTEGALLGAGGGGSAAASIYVTPTSASSEVGLGGASVSLSVTPAGTVTITPPVVAQTPVQPPFLEVVFCICVEGIYPSRP